MSNELAENSLKINPELVTEILCRFIATEIRRAGFERVVVGLSGGIDSSVVTFLCARALGPQNVLAVTMPYKTSSEATRRDSQAVIDQLGVRTVDVPIADQIDAYFSQFPDASQLRLANKCARERMTVLYDQSAAFGRWWRARATRASCFWATARSSATWPRPSIRSATSTRRNSTTWPHISACPSKSSTKEPTGDLWVGQTDEGELGFSYAEVDRLLVLLVDRRWRRAELLQAGFAAEFVDRVATMIRRNHYKRRMPVIAKLSHRTMDRDFRYARDWGT